MYYILHYQIPQDEDGGYFHINDGIEFDGFDSWSLGRRYEAHLPDPIEVELVPVDGYAGEPSEMYDGNICLMSDRMVASLRDAGVDNLDTYGAVLRNTVTGKTYPYQAVNIIGLVRGVDMAKSTWESYDGDGLFDTHFQGVAVDEDATKRLLLFRLAEHTGTIVVHESVRNRLVAAGFPSLVLLPPGEWTT